MSWLKLDDRLLDHPKFVRADRLAGSSAVHLWVGLLAYCKQHLTDGLVPADMINAVAGPARRWRGRALDALVTVGLVHREGDAYRLHDYLALNDSRAAIERKASERRGASERRPSVARALPDPNRSAPLSGPRKTSETETETEAKTKTVRAKSRAAPKPRWRNVRDANPDWKPNEYHAKLAAKYGKDLRLEAAKFRDFDFASPKSDPDRTFNNWLRRSHG